MTIHAPGREYEIGDTKLLTNTFFPIFTIQFTRRDDSNSDFMSENTRNKTNLGYS